ncbi:MAG: Cys-tRNA(Pro) deacylase [Candidatus Atribacteria bacterium]|nr:Cys-tRNA(Pro) deacylase [Candidatus Atribacteria bacterium]
MEKFAKTNAMRLLDQSNIHYGIISYHVNPTDLSAEHVSQETGVPLNQIFKTLVAQGDKTGELVACVSGNAELDLKKFANLSGNKRIALIPVSEIQKKTGYLRGGVSPIGMKHAYPLYIDQSALQHPFILVSAGLRGLQIKIKPQDLVDICQMKTASLV